MQCRGGFFPDAGELQLPRIIPHPLLTQREARKDGTQTNLAGSYHTHIAYTIVQTTFR